MKQPGLRTKLLFSFAVLLFILFLAGESDTGQRFLIGQPSDDHWARDDQYMGAGLAPFFYCAVPGGVLLLLSLVSYKAEGRRVE
jgi:hypothetical protein